MHDVFLADENAGEEQILDAMGKTGLAEYPHRHAYKELTSSRSDANLNRMVLEHVDESVRKRLEGHLEAGVPLEQIVSSDLFEQEFSPEERYQVEDAILDARDHIKEAAAESFDAKSDAYKAAVAKWEAYRDEVNNKIKELESLEKKDEKWREEIEGKVKRFQEGFLVTERDVELEEVEKEIEYWRGVFGEEI